MAHAITKWLQLLTKCQLVYLSGGTHRNVVLQGFPWRFLFTFIIYLNISVPCSQFLYCHLLVVPKYKPLPPLALNSIRWPPYHLSRNYVGPWKKLQLNCNCTGLANHACNPREKQQPQTVAAIRKKMLTWLIINTWLLIGPSGDLSW